MKDCRAELSVGYAGFCFPFWRSGESKGRMGGFRNIKLQVRRGLKDHILQHFFTGEEREAQRGQWLDQDHLVGGRARIDDLALTRSCCRLRMCETLPAQYGCASARALQGNRTWRSLWRVNSHHDGAWEVSWSTVCKLETREAGGMTQSKSKGLRTRGNLWCKSQPSKRWDVPAQG